MLLISTEHAKSNPQVVLMAHSLSIVWLIHVRWRAVHCSQQPLVRQTTVEGATQSSTWMMWKLHMHVVSQSFRLNMLPCLKSLFAGSGKFQWIFQRFNLSWTISNFSWYCIARYYCKLTITAELPFGSVSGKLGWAIFSPFSPWNYVQYLQIVLDLGMLVAISGFLSVSCIFCRCICASSSTTLRLHHWLPFTELYCSSILVVQRSLGPMI